MSIKDRKKWRRLNEIFLEIPMESEEHKRALGYWMKNFRADGIAEEILEKALILVGRIADPNAVTTSLDEREYNDIIAGEEIWVSIQKNSGN